MDNPLTPAYHTVQPDSNGNSGVLRRTLIRGVIYAVLGVCGTLGIVKNLRNTEDHRRTAVYTIQQNWAMYRYIVGRVGPHGLTEMTLLGERYSWPRCILYVRFIICFKE